MELVYRAIITFLIGFGIGYFIAFFEKEFRGRK